MTTQPMKVNGDTAPIKNVTTALTLVRSLQNRHPLQPNLGVLAGYSGYGKSVAALYCQNKTGAAYVEVRDTWTRAKLLRSILSELGVYQPRGTLSDMEDEVIGLLCRDPRRPLIIDEGDLLIKKNLIELVRGIAKASGVPVMLIGEELFPKKLERYVPAPSVHGDRVFQKFRSGGFGHRLRTRQIGERWRICRCRAMWLRQGAWHQRRGDIAPRYRR